MDGVRNVRLATLTCVAAWLILIQACCLRRTCHPVDVHPSSTLWVEAVGGQPPIDSGWSQKEKENDRIAHISIRPATLSTASMLGGGYANQLRHHLHPSSLISTKFELYYFYVKLMHHRQVVLGVPLKAYGGVESCSTSIQNKSPTDVVSITSLLLKWLVPDTPILDILEGTNLIFLQYPKYKLIS